MSEVVTLEADLSNNMLEDLTVAQREAYALHVFKAHTTDNPVYTSVGEPAVTFHDDVREGFLTAKIAFEVERA